MIGPDHFRMAEKYLAELPPGATKVSKSWDEVFYGKDTE